VIQFVVTVICTKLYQVLTELLKCSSDISSFSIWEGIVCHKLVLESITVNKEKISTGAGQSKSSPICLKYREMMATKHLVVQTYP
jgi:hypothetical protein